MTTFEVKRLKALYQIRLDIVDRAEQEEWSSQRLCIAQAKRDILKKILDNHPKTGYVNSSEMAGELH